MSGQQKNLKSVLLLYTYISREDDLGDVYKNNVINT
jgi:hypothetical protein